MDRAPDRDWRRAGRKLALWRAWARDVLPAVRAELAAWRRRAAAIPDPLLRQQALLSIRHKAFHCEGGAAFALLAPESARRLVRLIVALQTLSDVLDSWTDRAGVARGAEIRRLHEAMLDAVAPARSRGGTGGRYGPPGAGGYLDALVAASREQVARLPGLARVQGPLLRWAERYADLQVLKHRRDGARGDGLRGWYAARAHDAPGLAWWEFAAACGSTLPAFALLALAARPAPSAVGATLCAYAYRVAPLHILLDYLIDAEEDRLGGDFNLTAPYGDPGVALRRLAWLVRAARQAVRSLPGGCAHELLVQGLPALYLSDPKAAVLARRHPRELWRLLAASGRAGRLLYAAFRWRRLLRPLDMQQPGAARGPHAQRTWEAAGPT